MCFVGYSGEPVYSSKSIEVNFPLFWSEQMSSSFQHRNMVCERMIELGIIF